MYTLIRYLGFIGIGTFSFTQLYCLVGCLSMIVWTHAVLGVFYACVLYLYLFSAIEHVSHGNALYKYAYYYCNYCQVRSGLIYCCQVRSNRLATGNM